MAEKIKKIKAWQVGLAICMVYFMADLANILGPALAGLSEFYPDRSLFEIQELATANRLLAIFGCLLAGWCAGRKFGKFYCSFRLVVTISFLCQIVGGVLPMLDMHNFPLVQFARYLFGFGNGMCGGLSGALAVRCFAEGPLRDRWLGIGGFFQGFGGVIVPLIAGYVVALDISYVWPLHLVAVICLLLFLFWFREPARDADGLQDPDSEGAQAAAEADPRPSRPTLGVLLVTLAFFLDVIAVQQLLINASYIVEFNGWGDSAVSGWCLTLYFIGACVGSLLYPYFARVFGRFCIGIGLAVCAASLFVGFIGGNLVCLFIGSLAVGISANGMFLTGGFAYIGKKLNPKGVATAAGIFNAGGNLGAFFSPFLTALVVTTIFQSSDYIYSLLGGAVVYAIIAVIWLIYPAVTEKKEDWLPESKKASKLIEDEAKNVESNTME